MTRNLYQPDAFELRCFGWVEQRCTGRKLCTGRLKHAKKKTDS
jgi:hypothetical protein